MVCGPWGSPRTSQRSTGQNHFHDNTNTPFAIFPVLSLAQMSKSKGASTCWWLSTNPDSGTNHYSCVLFTPHTLGEEKPVLFRNVLMNCQTHWFSWTLTLYLSIFNVLCGKRAPSIKHVCIQVQWPSRGKAHTQLFVLQAQLATFSRNAIFIWKNSWSTMVVQTLVSGRNFLKNEQREPLTSQKTDSVY